MLIVKRLVLLAFVFALAACTQMMVMTRKDMDDVVNTKGMPLSVDESFVGGAYPRHSVTLSYRDGVYTFQTNAQKSYSILESSHTLSYSGGQQQPLPVWFKAKYPALDWTRVPTR